MGSFSHKYNPYFFLEIATIFPVNFHYKKGSKKSMSYNIRCRETSLRPKEAFLFPRVEGWTCN